MNVGSLTGMFNRLYIFLAHVNYRDETKQFCFSCHFSSPANISGVKQLTLHIKYSIFH